MISSVSQQLTQTKTNNNLGHDGAASMDLEH